MQTSDFDYELPPELIAQSPAEPRDACKLLVLNRATGGIEHAIFREIGTYLRSGDLLVVNETRVLPARLLGYKEKTGGCAEVLLLRRREDINQEGLVWECLVYPGKRLKPGARIEFFAHTALESSAQKPETKPSAFSEPVLRARIEDYVEGSRGGRLVQFEPADEMTLDEAIHATGKLPLPPYINSYSGDPEQYQTVYATQTERSAAAPTAGLHFTEELIDTLKAQGIGWANVELEVGIDTFRLVEEEDPTAHVIHTERYHISPETADVINDTRARGGRIVAVGTTSVRSLESAYDATTDKVLAQHDATTNLYLLPGSRFNVVDAMITNFHVPRSTLMMLVSAFASRELIMQAYQAAIGKRYRFFSFGDAMFIV